MKTVCLDPGHGGSDPGALGPTGVKESDMALDVCHRCRQLLLPYVNVIMTRESSGSRVSLQRRADFANEQNADVFVSYHFNSATSPAHGFEIFSTPGQNNSDKLATYIFQRHAEVFPDQPKRQDLSDGDADKEANFSVIRRAQCPAVLVEGEFIHTQKGEDLISRGYNRQLMAQAVAEGVLDYLNIDRDLVVEEPRILTVEARLARIERHLGLA